MGKRDKAIISFQQRVSCLIHPPLHRDRPSARKSGKAREKKRLLISSKHRITRSRGRAKTTTKQTNKQTNNKEKKKKDKMNKNKTRCTNSSSTKTVVRSSTRTRTRTRGASRTTTKLATKKEVLKIHYNASFEINSGDRVLLLFCCCFFFPLKVQHSRCVVFQYSVPTVFHFCSYANSTGAIDEIHVSALLTTPNFRS